MTKQRTPLGFLTTLGLVLASQGLAGCSGNSTTNTATASTAPVDLPASVSEQWRGKVVLADFWATWCGPCRASSPNVQMLHEQFAGDDNVLVVGVHADDGVDNPGAYLDENGYTYGFVEKGQDVANAFDVHALPTFVLLDTNGREVMRHVGMMSLKQREAFATKIASLRAGG